MPKEGGRGCGLIQAQLQNHLLANIKLLLFCNTESIITNQMGIGCQAARLPNLSNSSNSLAMDRKSVTHAHYSIFHFKLIWEDKDIQFRCFLLIRRELPCNSSSCRTLEGGRHGTQNSARAHKSLRCNRRAPPSGS